MRVSTAKSGQAVRVIVSFPGRWSLGTSCFCVFLGLLGEPGLAAPCVPGSLLDPAWWPHITGQVSGLSPLGSWCFLSSGPVSHPRAARGLLQP